jgi:GT2 family glycosyltransferase
MPSVSVIIINYNAGPLLARSIDSLIGADVEVIIVDNASSDDSLALATGPVTPSLPVSVICNPTNRGFAAACNQAIAAATSNLLCFLNPDCIMRPESLDHLVNTLLRHPEAGMAGGLLLNPDGTEQRGGRRRAPDASNALRQALWLGRFAKRRLSDFNMDQSPLPDGPIPVEAISGACMLVRREAIDSVGVWDEDFFLHCEDLDWCLRFRMKGWTILFDPGAPVLHDKGACSRKTPLRVEWYKHQGMLLYFRKHLQERYPSWVSAIIKATIMLRFLASAGTKMLSKPHHG